MKKLILLFGFFILGAWIQSDDFIARLSSKLDTFNQQRPEGHLYVVFNQDKYAESDTAYFSAYWLNADLLPRNGKKIVSLGIVNSEGELIKKINFNVQDGRASNQFVIPAQIKSGVYTVAAFDPETNSESTILFSKKITLVSKQKFLTKQREAKKRIEFYFEGGHFVNEVSNRIILLSDNDQGEGRIKNEKNEVVATFNIDNGIASAWLMPRKGSNYFVEMAGGGTLHPLTKAEEDGCTLLISNSSEPKSKKILVAATPQSAMLKQENFLVVVSRRKIIYAAPLAFDANAHFSATLLEENIPNGLTQVFILDKNGNVLAERKIFTNNTKVLATAEPSKKEFGQREKVEVEVSLRDRAGNPLQGDFAVSVVRADLSSSINAVSIFENILLGDLFSNTKNNWPVTKEERLPLINDLLITLDWTTVPWAEVLGNKPYKSPNNTSCLKLKGRALYKSSMKPVPDSTLVFGYLQNAIIGYETRTTKNGLFQLPFLFDFWGQEDVFYLMESKGKVLAEEYIIVPDSATLKFKRSGTTYPTSDSLDSYGDYSFKKKIADESYGFFAAPQKKSAKSFDLNEQFEEEAMGSDLTVKVQDYVVFPTMEDLIREVIPFLEHRKKGDKNSVRMLLNQKTNYIHAKSEPLFVIDGALTKNKDFFLSLKPVDIVTIKIINDLNKLSHLGALGKNGIVLVETKKSLASKVVENSTVLKIAGLSKAVPFSIKNYSSSTTNRLPDLRSTLYWNPFITVSALGKGTASFYTSDDIGEMRIIIKGFTKQGEPFYASSSFEVKIQKP